MLVNRWLVVVMLFGWQGRVHAEDLSLPLSAELTDRLEQGARAVQDKVVAWRRDLHLHP